MKEPIRIEIASSYTTTIVDLRMLTCKARELMKWIDSVSRKYGRTHMQPLKYLFTLYPFIYSQRPANLQTEICFAVAFWLKYMLHFTVQASDTIKNKTEGSVSRREGKTWNVVC